MTAYRRVYDSHQLQADCQKTGISSGTLRSVIEHGLPLPFYRQYRPSLARRNVAQHLPLRDARGNFTQSTRHCTSSERRGVLATCTSRQRLRVEKSSSSWRPLCCGHVASSSMQSANYRFPPRGISSPSNLPRPHSPLRHR